MKKLKKQIAIHLMIMMEEDRINLTQSMQEITLVHIRLHLKTELYGKLRKVHIQDIRKNIYEKWKLTMNLILMENSLVLKGT